MKTNKTLKIILAFVIISALALSIVACTNNNDSKSTTAKETTETIKVGFCAGPYADMFNEGIKPILEKKGYKIESVEFSDYVQPNIALANKEIDVNLFQHSTYLKNFNEDYKLDLSYITEVPTAGMGIFSKKYKSINDLPDGAMVAIPNDATNLSRSIRVLEQTGIVKIDPSVDPAKATENNLSENPKHLKFTEVEAPQLPRSLDSVDIAIINGNYAIGAGLKLSEALYNEEIADGYINVIAIRTEDKNSQLAKDIKEAVKSDEFKKLINDPSKQYSSFQKPKDFQ